MKQATFIIDKNTTNTSTNTNTNNTQTPNNQPNITNNIHSKKPIKKVENVYYL
jgi:hypothetical protein